MFSPQFRMNPRSPRASSCFVLFSAACCLSLSGALICTGCSSADNQAGPTPDSGYRQSTAANRSAAPVQVRDDRQAQTASDRTDARSDSRSGAAGTGAANARRDGDRLTYSLPFPTGDRSTSTLLIEKTVPAQVRVGQPFNYQIKVTNTSRNAAEGVEVTETVGEGFAIDRSDPKFRGNPDNGQLSWPIGALQPGQSKVINVTAVADQQGQVASCLSASYSPSICATLNVVQPELKLTKQAPSQLDICEPIVWEYTVTNSGTGRTEPITLREQLPDGLRTETGQNAINVEVGPLQQGESKRVSVRLKADRPGQYTSRAFASASGVPAAEARAAAARNDNGDNNDNNTLAAQSQNTSTTVTQPNLAVQIQGPEVEYVDRPATYRVTLTNNGSSAARDAVAAVTVPQGYRILDTGENAKASGNNIQWALGAIGPKDSKTASFTVEAHQADTFRADATAKADCAQQVTASEQTRFLTISALRLEVIDLADPVRVGDNVEYTIQVANQGNGPDTNIHITANIPPEQEFVSAEGASRGQVSEDKRHVDFGPVPRLDAKQSATWKVITKAKDKGDTRFEVQLKSDGLTKPAMETEPTRLY